MNCRRFIFLSLLWVLSVCAPGTAFLQARGATIDQCVYALDPSAANALYIDGAAIINAPGCGVVVDSSSSTALDFRGAGTFTAKYFDVAGGYAQNSGRFSPAPVTHSTPQSDPLYWLTPPSTTKCDYVNFSVGSGTNTLHPGTYCNGIKISGATNITFDPGMYILMGGGLNVSGASNLTGSGVTFFFTQGMNYTYGALNISGATIMKLSAPVANPYYGMLFYEDPRIGSGEPAASITGSSVSTLTGVVYFPKTGLTWSGAEAGQAGGYLILIADTITITGSAVLNNEYPTISPLQSPISVSVAPASSTLSVSQTQQFTATVTGTTNTAVNWTISPATAGSISATGLYTAPSTNTQTSVTVTATSQADPTKAAAATVTLSSAAVTVSPLTSTLNTGQTQQFTAIVTGTTNTAVSWMISPSGAGNISATGLYTAPSTINTQITVTVTAVSQADPTKAAAAAVTLSPVALTVAPLTSTLNVGQTQQFTAAVTGATNTGVNWTITPSTAGSIGATGLYTAPLAINTQTTVTVTATSRVDSNKAASATVTLRPVGVTVAPLTSTLNVGQTQQFTATVTGTANTAVNWTVSPSSAGSISAAGLYTAPTTISAQTTVTLTATSQVDSTRSAAAIVTLSPVAVTVSPLTSTLNVGQTQQFTATVTGAANTAVNWTISPSNAGSISAAGLYTAPTTINTQTTVNVTATSQVDSTKSASATVTLSPVAVTVSPLTSTLNVGQTQQFTATVTGTTNTAVNWTISPSSAGSINASGLYTAPATITAQSTVTVTAASQADSTKTATASVTLNAVSISLTPATSTLTAGQTQQFTATVTGTANTAVNWTISPTSAGSIGSAGLYTAPTTVTTPTTVTVTATSQANNTITATATVTLNPPVSVTVGPSISTLTSGQTQQFSATVTGSANTAVTWTIIPSTAGSISTAGLYTAPASIATQSTVIVTATSQADATKTASAAVTLKPPVSIRVWPSTTTLLGGQTQEFSALVLGSGNVSVNWSISPSTGAGTISASGFYVAPATVSTSGTVTVTAASQSDSTKTATATISLTPPIVVAISPKTTTLLGGMTQQLTAAVTGTTNAAVNWSVTQGTISPTGLYTAPATVTTPATVTITASSQADSTEYGLAQITLSPPVSVMVWPPSVSLDSQQTQQFTTLIDGQVNSAVTWTVNSPGGAAGSISATGLYTPPSNISSAAALTVTATSQTDSTKTGTATVNLTAVSLQVSPGGVLLLAGQSQQFTATVTGASNPAVAWSLFQDETNVPPVGTVSETGLYTAPATVISGSSFGIEAFSLADSTQGNSANITISGPITVSVSPAAVTLTNGQTIQFTGTANGGGITTGTGNWTITPAGAGSIDQTGLYTAPSNISSSIAVTVTTTSQLDPTKSGIATVTLAPTLTPITISVSPLTTSLASGETQQYTALVTGTANTAVNWTISPATAGSITVNGLYSAPQTTITMPRTVTVTATMAADSTKSASVTLVLTETPGSNLYTHRRPIVIDHTKVANSDQGGFPVLISGTYSYLANVANGGQVENANGYDIIFSSDCAGLQKLNYEIESYNPLTGAIVMWVQLPLLSHTTDTVFYIAYGSSTVTASQANGPGVWDPNYQMVLHLAETAAPYHDSTANAYASTGGTSPEATAGKIGGGQSFDGASQYIAWSQAQSPNPGGAVTLETWIKTSDASGAKGIFGKWNSDGTATSDQSFELIYQANGQPTALLGAYGGFSPELDSGTPINDGNWHHLALTALQTGAVTLYIDGVMNASLTNTQPLLNTTVDRLLAGATGLAAGAAYMRGSLDEIRISGLARSADWIQTQFNSQNSPSTFYTIYPETGNTLAPPASVITNLQSQQFTALFAGTTPISTQSNPLVPLGSVATPSSANSLAVNGNIAYLCDNNEISIIDVTNPAGPVLLGSSNSSYISNDGLTHCSIQRNALVEFADEAASPLGDNPIFQAFGLQTPAQPQLIAGTPVNKRFFAAEPVYVGNTAFVPTYGNTYFLGSWSGQFGDVIAVDISDFTSPLILGTLEPPADPVLGGSNAVFGATAVNSTTLLVASSSSTGGTYFGGLGNNGTGQLLAVDISNPASMNVVAQVPVPGTFQLYPPVIQGNFAVSLGDNGGFANFYPGPETGNLVLTIFNVANPRAPAVITSQVLPWLTGGSGASRGVNIGPNLFLFSGAVDSANNNYLLLVDITDLTNPSITAYPVASAVDGMVVAGTILHTSSPSGYASYRIPGTSTTTTILPGSCAPPVTWSINPALSGTITPTGADTAVFTPASGITSQQAVTVTATSTVDTTQTASSTVTVNPSAQTVQTTLTLTSPAPGIWGGIASFEATVTDTNGNPAPGVGITFSVGGANANSNVAPTTTVNSDASGHALYSYEGARLGADTITATPALNGTAATVSLSWIQLEFREPIATTVVSTLFFTSPSCASGCEAFTTPVTQAPAFTQNFPDIDFNGRPFIDNAEAASGGFPSFAGNLTAGGVGFQAGVGPLTGFSAVFRGTFVVGGAGPYQLNIGSADGFILGVSGGAARVSGPLVNLPVDETTPFSHYPVMGSNNGPSNQSLPPIVVSFPSPGQYPYELDYQSGTGGIAYLQMGATLFNQNLEVVPPITALIVNSNSPALAGQPNTVFVQAIATNGSPAVGATVNLTVAGANPQTLVATADNNGNATLTYTGAPGTDILQATANIDGFATVSNQVTVSWAGTGGSGAAPSVQISGESTQYFPYPGFYYAQITDPANGAGGNITTVWSQVSGPATVLFDSPQSSYSNVTFPVPGNYTLQLTAADALGSTTVTVGPITVLPPNPLSLTSGWIQTPLNHATVSGVVPIVLIPAESLLIGTLYCFPANNPSAVMTLSNNTTGGGTIATLDTTQLANGSYYIYLTATDTNYTTMASVVEIQVTGNYKPGRVTTTITDLTVPAPGLPIQIQRTYDSLVRSTSSDFGYGWSLGVNVQLDVSPLNDVTLTINGQRHTFYFSPYVPGFAFPGIGTTPPHEVPNILGTYLAAYTPEPGFYGTLTLGSGAATPTGTASGCALDWLMANGPGYICYGDAGTYSPGQYIYTDPYGRAYTINANGGLQSIQDLGGNTLTVTPNGISSTNGLSVPFVRDSSGRITQITDTLGNIYQYGYDTSGNLASVSYPGLTTPASYTYDPTHNYTGGTDPRGNALPITTYDTTGRLLSVTDALSETTSYAYDLTNNITTITNPPDANGQVGTATLTYDSYGMLLTSTDPLNNTTTNTYDANHNLTSVTDPLGHAITYTYDSNGNRTSITHPMTPGSVNTTTTTLYNQYSEPAQTSDELGNVTTFTYDSNFWPKLASDGIGPAVSFTFNTNGTQAAKATGYDLTQTPGAATAYTYDAYGNMTSQTDPLGRVRQYAYDTQGRLTSTTPPAPSAPTTYSYDALGNTKTITAPLGRATNYRYDANGNKIGKTDSNGNTTTYQYDTLNRLTQITYPTTPATSTSFIYDFRNNIVNTTDQAGNVTHNVYDLAGRLTASTSGYGTPQAATVSHTWYHDGRTATDTDSGGNTSTRQYDDAGRLIGFVDAQLNATSYAYDDAGNQVLLTDANQHKTQLSYDSRRRFTQTAYDDGTTKKYTYDGPGNLISVTDQAGKTVNYAYDLGNQLKSVIQPASPNPQNTTSYVYDPSGNLTTATDANSHATNDGFDFLSRLVMETLPTGLPVQTRAWDPVGNLTSLVDFNGKTTTYNYDALNRLITKTPDPGTGDATVTLTYTATGRRATMTDASGTTTYTYDALNRLATKGTPRGTLTYAYDPAGNLASMSSSNVNGTSVSYAYDQLNRLSSVIDNRLPVGQNTTVYSYDPASNLATVNYPNGLQSSFTYDHLNRVTALNATKASYNYTLGPAGNSLAAVESSGRTVNWNYDGIYRLTSETVGSDPNSINGSVGYGLDPVGNRQSQASSIPGIATGAFTYDPDDRLFSETWDNNGNVLTIGARTFAYDFENRLKSMNAGAVTLQYDGDGNRVAKTVAGVTTRYLVDDLNPTGYAQVVEELVGGAVQRSYTYGTQRISQNQLVSNTWTPAFYNYDAFASVRQLADLTGTVIDTYDYDSWGNLVHSTGKTPNNYLYRSEQYDADLGLYYLRARYYNPLTGRFVSRDSNSGNRRIPASQHTYIYVDDAPVNASDPSGHGTDEEYEEPLVLNQIEPLEAAAELPRGLPGEIEFPGEPGEPGPPGYPGPGIKELIKYVFFSGGPAARAAATAFAIARGAITLEMTPEGQRLLALEETEGFAAIRPQWIQASIDYAKHAVARGSDVVVFLGENVNPDGIWNAYEKEILESGGIDIGELPVP